MESDIVKTFGIWIFPVDNFTQIANFHPIPKGMGVRQQNRPKDLPL